MQQSKYYKHLLLLPMLGTFILLAIACASISEENASESFSASSSSRRSFSDFYKSWLDEKNAPNLLTLKEGENPRLIRSNNIDDDLFEYLSDYYIVIGDTGFNGPSRDIIDDIKEQCKKNGATIALYSIEYAYTTGSYSVRRYDYSVYYLARKTERPKSFGLWLVDLSSEDRRSLEMNTGAKVYVVYKNTPAFYANFLRDDIIISINEYKITDADDFYLFQLLYNFNDSNEGKEIEIEFIRNNQVRKNKIKIE